MAEEYGFQREICFCGLDLTDKKAAVSGSFEARYPTGKCPGCGKNLILDAPPIEPEIPAPRPETEPEPE